MSAVDYDQAFVRHDAIAPLPPPPATVGLIGWLRRNLFNSWTSVILTVLAIGLIAWVLPSILRFLVFDAVWVGEGRWSADDLTKALEARNRTACGPVAPPDGLFLVRVGY